MAATLALCWCSSSCQEEEVLTGEEVWTVIYVAHKKKKMFTPKKNKEAPRNKKELSKKKPLKGVKILVVNLKKGRRRTTLGLLRPSTCSILLRMSFLFVWRSGKLLKPDTLRLGLELIEADVPLLKRK